MEITVVGRATRRRQPERATATLVVEHEGADLGACVQRTTDRVEQVAAAARELVGGAVEHVVVDPLQTHAWRQDDGAQVQARFAASSRVVVTFTDTVELSAFLGAFGVVEGVRLDGVDWSVSDDELERLEALVLADAVAAARARATTVAQAAGVGEPQLVEMADPGLLSRGPAQEEPGGGVPRARSLAAAAGAIDVAPRDVVVTAAVHARFTA